MQSNGRSGEDGEAELENNYRDNRRRNWDGFTFHGGRLWWIYFQHFLKEDFFTKYILLMTGGVF